MFLYRIAVCFAEDSVIRSGAESKIVTVIALSRSAGDFHLVKFFFQTAAVAQWGI